MPQPTDRKKTQLLEKLRELVESGELESEFEQAASSTQELLDELHEAQEFDPEVLRQQVTI